MTTLSVFPEQYRFFDAIWLYRRINRGLCPICHRPAEYSIQDEEGTWFLRCSRCFEELLKFKRILFVDEEFWRKVLSFEFKGLRRNTRKAEDEIENVENVGKLKEWCCDICGCRFLTLKDFESHYNAWHKPREICFKDMEKRELFHGKRMEKIHREIMEKPRGGVRKNEGLR